MKAAEEILPHFLQIRFKKLLLTNHQLKFLHTFFSTVLLNNNVNIF